MKTRNENMKVKALALAVQGVLAAMYAMPVQADEAGAAALKLPDSFIEAGASGTSRDSAKFGEYNGINRSGANIIGNFSLRGGDAYGDGNGTKRWSISGTDLGFTNRAAEATFSDQGRWTLGIGYDELKHNLSDTYQTPYVGSPGSAAFSLPGFGLAPNTRAMSAAQLGSFHEVDISSRRQNTSLSGGYNLNRQWDVKFDFNQLNQSGAKLMSVGAAAIGGAGGQVISVLPMPTNFRTNTANLAVNWLGDKGHATASYFGSYFTDETNGVLFQTFQGAANTQVMPTAPSNTFHQFNLNGGYAFSARTKLTGGFSYGRNTQDATYTYDSGVSPNGALNTGPMLTASPTTSLGGFVATRHADLKLVDQTTKNLALSAGLKYDLRDNQTASNNYNFYAIDGSNPAKYPNTPLSIRKTQVELAGDYRLDQKQQFRLAYNHEHIDRWCSQYASGGGFGGGSVTAIAGVPYAVGTNCVTATDTRDNKLSGTYRRKAGESVNLNLGYTFSDRNTTFDQYARTAMIGTSGNFNAGDPAASLFRGLNAGDWRGFNPWFEASRRQQAWKGGVNWQATDRLSFTVGGRSTYDNYDNQWGVQEGKSWSLNLDSSYNYSENGSIGAYVSRQVRQRDMTNLARGLSSANATPMNASWNNNLTDRDATLGINFKQGGLMGGKLELKGDVSYSLGQTSYNTTWNYGTGSSCYIETALTCVGVPDIRSTMGQFKLSGTYALDKSSKINVGYLYRRLRTDDFYYNGYQVGYTPTAVMPTNEQSPNYAVSLFSASYIYTFK